MVRTLIRGLQKTSQQYISFAFSEKATGLCSGISPATSVQSQAVFNGTSLHNIRDGIHFFTSFFWVKNLYTGTSGTAPLNGERAQRDLARTSPWSFEHIGIRQGPCARTSSRSLGYIGIREKSSVRPTSSLR